MDLSGFIERVDNDIDVYVVISVFNGETMSADVNILGVCSSQSSAIDIIIKNKNLYCSEITCNSTYKVIKVPLDKKDSNNPVENVIWVNDEDFHKDVIVTVDHYGGTNHDPTRYGFDLQVEVNGEVTTYRYSDKFTGNNVEFLSLFRNNGKVEVKVLNSDLELVSSSSTLGKQFITVSKIMLSPNYWKDEVGNKHIFFITNDFEVKDDVRGFFNEYLNNDLREHRKVFEILGARSKISDNKELAVRGYGFSSTMDNELIVRVTRKNGRKQLYKILVK